MQQNLELEMKGCTDNPSLQHSRESGGQVRSTNVLKSYTAEGTQVLGDAIQLKEGRAEFG